MIKIDIHYYDQDWYSLLWSRLIFIIMIKINIHYNDPIMSTIDAYANQEKQNFGHFISNHVIIIIS